MSARAYLADSSFIKDRTTTKAVYIRVLVRIKIKITMPKLMITLLPVQITQIMMTMESRKMQKRIKELRYKQQAIPPRRIIWKKAPQQSI
jgi:hypothetical protein